MIVDLGAIFEFEGYCVARVEGRSATEYVKVPLDVLCSAEHQLVPIGVRLESSDGILGRKSCQVGNGIYVVNRYNSGRLVVGEIRAPKEIHCGSCKSWTRKVIRGITSQVDFWELYAVY